MSAAAIAPATTSVARLREAAAGCRACHLWKLGTQTVFGEGAPRAAIVLVGEQPGDRDKKPDVAEINACHRWLDAEIAAVRPRVIVCLGATATRAVLGPGVKVMQGRGLFHESPLAALVTVTVHPSSILRAPDAEARRQAMTQFVADLKGVAHRLADQASAAPAGAAARAARTGKPAARREASADRPRRARAIAADAAPRRRARGAGRGDRDRD